jgi:hypothetical protein
MFQVLVNPRATKDFSCFASGFEASGRLQVLGSPAGYPRF